MGNSESLKPNISIVLPTFNEEDNVHPIVAEIEMAFAGADTTFEIVFVDDSTDGTPALVEKLSRSKPHIRLIHRAPEDRTGLGTAILAGFNAANADIVCSMDSDLQHPPRTILEMYKKISESEVNFVVASRRVEDGSSDGLANAFRHVVSNVSSWLSWFVLPLTRKTTDPMTGFFMLEKHLLLDSNFKPIGFKLLVEILARVPKIKSVDVAFQMRKREFGESKASFIEGIRYFRLLLKLMFATPRHSILKYMYLPVFYFAKYYNVMIYGATAIFVGAILFSYTSSPLDVILLTISLILIVQLVYTLYILMYAWDNPDRISENASPTVFKEPTKSFTAVVPALNEAEVIPHTIRAVAGIEYPEHLKETLIVLRDTDTETVAAARKTVAELGKENVSIHLISGEPFNKPHHLNAALQLATKDVICIFDAEDEPHHEIYDVVNTVMLRDSADVVQCGVQLMNFESSWYSLFNVLEYFLWFGSALHFYQRQGIIPLGGNTVFFKTDMVKELGGWDMEGLTEDAEIGLRLSAHGANIRVVYDPKHATQEETPPTLTSFIKQRTRWSQGFLQILAKRKELRKELPSISIKKEVLTWYILGWPRIHALMFMYIPVAVVLSFVVKVHPVVAIISTLPIVLLMVYLVLQNIALYEFTKIYNKRWHPGLILKTIVWFFPYQFVLSFSSFRAMVRQFKQQTSWEKTEHVNAHRTVVE